MNRSPSPLRYPGGKAILSEFLQCAIYDNGLQGCSYIEPFAGGAGAGLELLTAGHVDRVVINDVDRAIYSFWNSVIKRPKELVDRIENTPLTVSEWRRQRDIYRGSRQKQIDLGFATFFLNRCNRSGIIKNAGPIGGLDQTGEWKIDARFNRKDLAGRITELASYGDRIIVTNEDAISLISSLDEKVGYGPKFIYADPPYYVKGAELYLSHFCLKDHQSLASVLHALDEPWVLTYDDVVETRQFYAQDKYQSDSTCDTPRI